MYPEKGRLHKAHSQSNWGENHHSIDHIGENISPFCQIWEFVIFLFWEGTHQLSDFEEISTILLQYQPQIQEYQPFKQNGWLSTNGR